MRNKQVAAMLGVLTVAAILVVFLATRGANYTAAEDPLQETEDVSDKAHIFSTHS